MAFRAFVGVPVPPLAPVVQLLDGLAALRADLKVVDAERLHFTLAFLGDVEDDAAAPLGAALDDAARAHAPFEAQLAGVGAFPNARHPRVVWLGVADPDKLVKLALDVRARIAASGQSFDTKDFRAHATLARTRSARGLAEVVRFLREHGRDDAGTARVDLVRLYRSRLGPEGPAYDVVHESRLEA